MQVQQYVMHSYTIMWICGCPRATTQLGFGFAASDACLALNLWHNGAGLFLSSRPTQRSERLSATTAEALSSVWGIQVWKVLVVSFPKCVFFSHESILLPPLTAWHTPKALQCIVSGTLYFPKLNFHMWKKVEVSGDLFKASWRKWQRQFASNNFQMRHKREWKLPPESRTHLLHKRALKLTPSVSQGCGKRDKFKGGTLHETLVPEEKIGFRPTVYEASISQMTTL